MLDWNTVSKLSPSGITNLQNQKIRYLFHHLLPFHPYYRDLLQREKIDPKSINTAADLVKIPFTTKLDLLPSKEHPARHKDFIFQPTEQLIKQNYPLSQTINLAWRKMIGEDVQRTLEQEYKPIHIHFTTGRSSDQIPFLYTACDLDTLGQVGRRLFELMEGTKDEVVVNGFPFAPHLAFWLGFHAPREVGLLSIQTGGGKIMGTQKIIDAIEKMQASMLFLIPGFGYHLFREAAKQTRDFSRVKFVVFGGERVNPGLREKVKSLLKECGAASPKILSTYAFTEGKAAWMQCHEQSGYHLYPDLEYIELVDEHGHRVKEGEPGEIVYTSLGWRGSSVIRYRTGDFAKGLYYSKPCEFCGRTVPRIHYDIERRSEIKELNLTKIKGQLVNLNNFYTIIHSVPEVDEWQVEIKKHNNDPYDLDELVLYISLRNNKKDKSIIIDEIKALIQREFTISVQIEIYSTEEMINMLGLENELKEKRIVDKRTK